jgi:predicted amidohydrolase
MRTATLGLAFVDSTPEDKEANWRTAERLFRDLADQGADIALTPESCLGGYLCYVPGMTADRLRAAAEPLDGPYVARMRALARELSIYLAPCFDELDGGSVYSTALLIGPDGELVGHYRKVHMGAGERSWWKRGDEFPVFETRLGKVGFMICFDRQLPESARLLALQGAEMLLVPTAGAYGEKKYERNLAMMKTRAYENKVFVAMVHPTEGLVVNPLGEVIARKGFDEQCFVRRVDLDYVATCRQGDCRDLLAERRPELYGPLCMPMQSDPSPEAADADHHRHRDGQMARR